MTTFYCLSFNTPPTWRARSSAFISLRKRVTRLYPQALGSLFVASYDSQGYSGVIRPRLHTRVLSLYCQFSTDSIEPLCTDQIGNIVSSTTPIVMCLPICCLEKGSCVVACMYICAGTCLPPFHGVRFETGPAHRVIFFR
jgi:hypothetical protein